MKKFTYILICLLWFSCANESKNKSESVMFDTEELSTDNDDTTMDLNVNSYENLATQKLIDYFDLLRLKQMHPEFEKDIRTQLEGFMNDSESIDSFQNIDSIKNIRTYGVVLKTSDSLQKLKLYFDVVSENQVQTDSILAIISTKTILMDDMVVATNKVSFQKIQ